MSAVASSTFDKRFASETLNGTLSSETNKAKHTFCSSFFKRRIPSPARTDARTSFSDFPFHVTYFPNPFESNRSHKVPSQENETKPKLPQDFSVT